MLVVESSSHDLRTLGRSLPNKFNILLGIPVKLRESSMLLFNVLPDCCGCGHAGPNSCVTICPEYGETSCGRLNLRLPTL